ncbi:MAG TPA: hypothetical protein VGH19_10575 [Verrucomicrobiae bacterium]
MKTTPKSRFVLITLIVCLVSVVLLAPFILDHVKARKSHQEWQQKVTVSKILLMALDNYQMREGQYPNSMNDLGMELDLIFKDAHLAKGLARFTYERAADGGFELKCDGDSVAKRSNHELSSKP